MYPSSWSSEDWMLLLHLELQTGIWVMHGRLMEVISKRAPLFSVSLGQRRRWTHCRILLFNLCTNKRGFVLGVREHRIILWICFAVQKTWQYNVELVDGPCSRICHRPEWLGACGLGFRDTASRCQLTWLCFIGSLVTAPFDGLISRTSMYQTGCCDYSNAAMPGRSYRSHFLRLTVFCLGGLASTAWVDWSTNLWPNLKESLWLCDQLFIYFESMSRESTLSPVSYRWTLTLSSLQLSFA